jgi:hypothetical protein
MVTHCAPVMFGSEREMLSGIVRALPTPGSPAPVRAIHVAAPAAAGGEGARPPSGRDLRGGADAVERLGFPRPVGELFIHLTERWDGKGYLRRAKGAEIPLALRIT